MSLPLLRVFVSPPLPLSFFFFLLLLSQYWGGIMHLNPAFFFLACEVTYGDGVRRLGASALLTLFIHKNPGNSLSSEACRGLQPTMCTLSGTTAGGFVFGTETANGAAGGARPTGPAGLAAAAACVGLVGAVAAAAGGVAAMGIL